MPTISVVDSDVEGQTLVEQLEDDGATLTRSWHDDAIPVEARLNPDAPPATDMRSGSPTHGELLEWAMPSAATWARMGGTEDQRQAFRAAMLEQGRDVEREV